MPRLIPRVLVEVLIGLAGIQAKCFGVVPISKFTKKHRSNTTAIGRTCDVVFSETISFPLKERLAFHGACRDSTFPAPRVADDSGGWNVVIAAYAWEGSPPVFAKSNGLQDVLMVHMAVERSDRTLGSIGESGASFEAVKPDLKEQSVFETAFRHETRAVMKARSLLGGVLTNFARGSVERSVSVPPWSRRSPMCEHDS